MSSPARVVIVGASIGGLTAAETLRQEGFDGEIVLVGDEPHLPYTRPPLSKQILLGDWTPAHATILTAGQLDDLHIEIRTGCSAVGLDTEARVLQTSAGSMPYDELIIATGTMPRSHPLIPSASLRTMDDAIRVRDRMEAARRVAVVGSGILGSEVASAARARDAEALLIGRSGILSFGGAGTLLDAQLRSLHVANGVELALRTRILAARSTESGTTELVFEDGNAQTFDLVVTMIGSIPCTDWLASSSLDVTDGIGCDPHGSAADGVWAVGDVAAWFDPVRGRRVRIEHQSNAIEQAIGVATRIVHGTDSPQPVPLFWSEIHGARIQAYGRFAPERPLEDISDGDGTGPVYASRDAAGEVRGVIGWNTPPRAFRDARAAVVTAAPDLITHPTTTPSPAVAPPPALVPNP
ncbi:NAD(P)/FAD-dependent oxidoreductase [Microbacterium paludicola]|uniref:NAD(P)/FAD-dependent oxidoreductase n=1 Tax=Microbacterium paludicola TaxID=300019 RepID=UPI00119C9D47|nr:FAD-dependent oxidoreductase [Microbacterium paludicola]